MAITAKTSNQAIIDAINANNLGLNLTLEQVTVGDIIEGGTEEQTSLVLTAIADQGYTGEATITYTRQPASLAIGALGDCVVPAGLSTEEEIRAWFMEVYLVKSPVPLDENFELTITLETKVAKFTFTGHKVLFGSHELVYAIASPALSDAITMPLLSAFSVEDVTPAGV